MINGATQIVSAVPGQNLDPMLLAKSQPRESTGFIMITYETSTEQMQLDLESMSPVKKFFDVLFFKNASVYESARINQDLRFILNSETALKTFSEHRHENTTLVYLYKAPEEIVVRFRSTFYYEPCLKVQLGSLNRSQVTKFLRSSHCRHGIIECNEFLESTPSIQLMEIHSEDELGAFNPTLKRGRLLLYDVDKNREIIHERYSRTPSDVMPIAPSFRMGDNIEPRPIMPTFRVGNDTDPQLTKAQAPALSKAEADDFSDFIRQILNSPVSAPEPIRQPNLQHQKGESKETPRGLVIRVQEDIRPATEPEQDTKPGYDSGEGVLRRNPTLTPRTKKGSREVKNKIRNGGPTRDRQLALKENGVGESLSTIPEQQSEFVRTFERLFRSFRQQVFEHFGEKCEEVIARAEKKVRILSPEFDYHSITDETAVSALEIIEEIVNQASFMKRSRLRQAAITLISDLYNKQYNLLESHRVIDRVEEIYYRLKR